MRLRTPGFGLVLQLAGAAAAAVGVFLLFGLGWTLLAVGVVVAGLGVLKEAGLI